MISGIVMGSGLTAVYRTQQPAKVCLPGYIASTGDYRYSALSAIRRGNIYDVTLSLENKGSLLPLKFGTRQVHVESGTGQPFRVARGESVSVAPGESAIVHVVFRGPATDRVHVDCQLGGAYTQFMQKLTSGKEIFALPVTTLAP